MARDLRAHSRQTQVRLVLGFILILFLIGDGLIYLVYGRAAALTGLLCLLAGLAPLSLIWIALLIIEWVTRRAEES